MACREGKEINTPYYVLSTVLETLGYMDGLNTEPAWFWREDKGGAKLYLRAACVVPISMSQCLREH